MVNIDPRSSEASGWLEKGFESCEKERNEIVRG